jgi:CRP/FNR family transcriptional regulator, transcriptional activator FtrB
MRPDDIPELRALELFRDMTAESFEGLARGAYVQTFPPQVQLIAEGDHADFLHVVLSGQVELFAGWSDRETVMATLRPVSTFILAATVRDRPYLMSARTLEKARIALIPSEDVRAIFERDGAFARAVVVELAACYRTAIKTTKDLKLRSAIERLANYLLRQRSRLGPRFELPIEKRRLASYLGMTPENLSRSFATLSQYGVVVEGPMISIPEPADLMRLARPTQLIDDMGY